MRGVFEFREDLHHEIFVKNLGVYLCSAVRV